MTSNRNTSDSGMSQLITLDAIRTAVVIHQKQQAGVPLRWREAHWGTYWLIILATPWVLLVAVCAVLAVVHHPASSGPPASNFHHRASCQEFDYTWDYATRTCGTSQTVASTGDVGQSAVPPPVKHREKVLIRNFGESRHHYLERANYCDQGIISGGECRFKLVTK
jgi:hypothetical protein